MTKKRFRGKMMQLRRNLNTYAKKNGMRTSKTTDFIHAPNWGIVITSGKHKGEKLCSYEQCWDMVTGMFEGSEVLQGIK